MSKSSHGVNLREFKDKQITAFDEEIKKYSQRDSFFCSELLAVAYKIGGLLGTEKSSTRYFPGAFSSKKKLLLKKGASLSCEYNILLNEIQTCLTHLCEQTLLFNSTGYGFIVYSMYVINSFCNFFITDKSNVFTAEITH